MSETVQNVSRQRAMDHPGRFPDLLLALRHPEASSHTLFDPPALTGPAMSMREALDALG